MGTPPATSCSARSPTSCGPTCEPSTSSAATAARNSSSSCPRPTSTRRHRSPRSSVGWSVATRSRSTTGIVAPATLSAGVAGGFGGHLELESLVRDADNAMYSAKALGRDQVYVFHELEDNGLVRRAAIAPSARNHAIEVGRAAFGGRDRFADRRARRPTRLGRQAVVDDRRRGRRARARAGPAPRARSSGSGSPACCTTWASSPSRDEILTKPGELNEPGVADRRREHPQDRPGHPRAGRRPARRGNDRAPPSRVVRRPRLPARASPARRSRSGPGSWRSPTPTRRWSPGRPVPRRHHPRGGDRRAPPPWRHAVRSVPGRGVRRPLRRAHAVRVDGALTMAHPHAAPAAAHDADNAEIHDALHARRRTRRPVGARPRRGADRHGRVGLAAGRRSPPTDYDTAAMTDPTPSLATPYRTHTCGQLRAADAGTDARLAGWVHRRRDYGELDLPRPARPPRDHPGRRRRRGRARRGPRGRQPRPHRVRRVASRARSRRAWPGRRTRSSRPARSSSGRPS